MPVENVSLLDIARGPGLAHSRTISYLGGDSGLLRTVFRVVEGGQSNAQQITASESGIKDNRTTISGKPILGLLLTQTRTLFIRKIPRLPDPSFFP